MAPSSWSIGCWEDAPSGGKTPAITCQRRPCRSSNRRPSWLTSACTMRPRSGLNKSLRKTRRGPQPKRTHHGPAQRGPEGSHEGSCDAVPSRSRHDGWDIIRLRMRRGPISENTIFLMTAGPALMLLVSRHKTRPSAVGQDSVWCPAILVTTIVGMLRRWHQQINRPALNLVRAMDVEAHWTCADS